MEGITQEYIFCCDYFQLFIECNKTIFSKTFVLFAAFYL